MKIQFKKGIAKPSVLNCIRDDGSVTWAKLRQGMETHDLAHYAVETVMEFKMAFFGILREGYAITDFELPAHKKPQALLPSKMHETALQTEHIVNLLQIEFFNTGHNKNFLSDLEPILAENELPFPLGLDEGKLEKIRSLFSELLFKWGALGEGEILELRF
ncbi:hypothetical protein [Spongiimicrobium salis]|uniref:hypothetical protein n=1 Tax=Spongiimicrobium salis TaxID=1667022 RepID=UPI00374D980D